VICVYDPTNTNFDSNGNAVLTPTEARVKQVAGGSYEFTMTHPIDPDGKWQHLVPGAVIRTPVPEEIIENAFSGYEADVYVTNTKVEMREGTSEPTAISYTQWTPGTSFAVGGKCSFLGHNYQCTYMDPTSAFLYMSPNMCAWWKEIPNMTSGSAVVATLPAGTELYFMEDAGSGWYKMSTPYGVIGYVKATYLTYSRHLSPSETQPRHITTQLMRITNATVDTKGHTVSVTAQHISYDLNGILVKDVVITQATPAMAIGKITEALMIPYPGTIATNLAADGNGTYTDSIKGKTGIYCLLDPDKGVVSKFNAAFRRDNWDLFVMQKTETDRGFRLKYRKNMLGANWARKSDSLVNRVIPVAKDESGAELLLPEVYVDSPLISSYPIIRMERLTVSGQVGKPKDDEGTAVWTLADLYTEMRTKAGERYSVDHADQVANEVTVDFEMIGDTAEYAELKGLEQVILYDKVKAENDEIGLNVSLEVTELEFDAIRKKVVSLKLSNVQDKGRGTVTGYSVQAKSIGADKLADDVQIGIVNQVRDIIPEYADPEAKRPTECVDSLDSTSTVLALAANQGRVLNETGLMRRGWLADNTDLNSVVGIGFYGLYTGRTYSHTPPETVYGLMVLRITATSNNIFQIGMGSSGRLYYRLSSDGGSNFSSWYKITTST